MPKITIDELKDRIQSLQTFKGKVVQPWMRRAMLHPELHTKDNESVQSASGSDERGKELLHPTIRMRGPGLEKLVPSGTSEEVRKQNQIKAFKESVKRKDYLEFDTPDEAKAYSTAFSNELGRRGQKREKDMERQKQFLRKDFKKVKEILNWKEK